MKRGAQQEEAGPAKTKDVEVRLKVPFHDVDPMRVVWHGHYMKYFEIAREALFEGLGVDLTEYFLRTGCMFPIVKASIKYVRPLKHRDEFICRAKILEAHRKIIIEYEILTATGQMCSSGRSEQAAVNDNGSRLEMIIPDEIRRGLGFE